MTRFYIPLLNTSANPLSPDEQEKFNEHFQRCRKYYYLILLIIIPWVLLLIYLNNSTKPSSSALFFTLGLSLLFAGIININIGKISQEMKIFVRGNWFIMSRNFRYTLNDDAVYLGKYYYYSGWVIVLIAVVLLIIGW